MPPICGVIMGGEMGFAVKTLLYSSQVAELDSEWYSCIQDVIKRQL